jgi:hypothetical protein
MVLCGPGEKNPIIIGLFSLVELKLSSLLFNFPHYISSAHGTVLSSQEEFMKYEKVLLKAASMLITQRKRRNENENPDG